MFSNAGKVWFMRDSGDDVHHAVGDSLKGGAVNDDLASVAGLGKAQHSVTHLASILAPLADLIGLQQETFNIGTFGCHYMRLSLTIG